MVEMEVEEQDDGPVVILRPGDRGPRRPGPGRCEDCNCAKPLDTIMMRHEAEILDKSLGNAAIVAALSIDDIEHKSVA